MENQETEEMFKRAHFITRLVASSVKISETAGSIIKGIMSGGDLKIVDKADSGQQADLQTEADRAAQYCIEKSLQEKFQNRLKIIGEEEVTSKIPNRDLSFSMDVLKMDSKLPEDLRKIKEEDVVIWVDPLDGTSEFAAALKGRSPSLQQVTVLIGIAYQGKSVAGVIHQPYYSGNEGRTLWGIVGMGAYGLEVSSGADERIIVTTRSHSNVGVQNALESLQKKKLCDKIVQVSGAGFKVLRCLEGAAAYVFASDGCKKWDTCAPEAVLIAAGGMLTDISGQRINYHADVQYPNSGGVLATAPWVEHMPFVEALKDSCNV
uniref:3'(2'),5'-bisphosphate nucleotidase 1 n=1 Tax=Panagrolaimus sp. ES5 TaxID=591445 RepID=A0AC34FND9_9BILA